MNNYSNAYEIYAHVERPRLYFPPKEGLFLFFTFTFTFMHLADAFIQSDLQCIQAIHFFFLSVCVFPGN